MQNNQGVITKSNLSRITLVFIMGALLFSCSTLKKTLKNKVKYFEGTITYDITYESENYNPEKIQELAGSKMVMTFKEGNYTRKYYSPNGVLLNERFLDLDKERTYAKSVDDDTIFWSDITTSDVQSDFNEIEGLTVLGHETIGVTQSVVVNSKEFAKPFVITGKYYYAKDLLVDPNWYINHKEENFDELIKLVKGIKLYSVSNGIFWTTITTASSVDHHSVDFNDIALSIDPNAPMKEL